MRKNTLPISLFTYYSLRTTSVPLLKSWPASIPRKKDGRVGKKTANKEERKRKKKERERKIEKYSQKSQNFGLCACLINKKAVWLRDWSEKNAVFVAKFILTILLAMLIGRKPVQRRGRGEKCGFFATRQSSPKG